jgi:hypothetical protein
MEGLRAIQLTTAEGAALAAALESQVKEFADVVPDHDIVQHVLRTGGAIHVIAPESAEQERAKKARG